jgi:hypothetical protein
MDGIRLKETVYGGVNLIRLTKIMVYWWAIVNAVMN